MAAARHCLLLWPSSCPVRGGVLRDALHTAARGARGALEEEGGEARMSGVAAPVLGKRSAEESVW